MVVVVGPSGAGKDTLIAAAAQHFSGRPDIVFARRIITRDAAAGGEDHDGVSHDDFDSLDADGRFAVSWNAHGLRYGIAADTLSHVQAGRMVIANGSRSALPCFKAVYGRILVLNVTARLEVLAERLEARGRETRSEILARLERAPLAVTGQYEVVTIDNSGSVDTAAKAMIRALSDVLG